MTEPTARQAEARYLHWVERLVTALVVLFFIADGAVKFLDIPEVVASFDQLGYPARVAPVIGLIGLSCAALYAFRRTAILGAVLITGLCGGAVASHLRIGSPVFTHVLFGVYVGLMAWGGLWLRDARLRALSPLRPPAD